jgi:hypothetical protein
MIHVHYASDAGRNNWLQEEKIDHSKTKGKILPFYKLSDFESGYRASSDDASLCWTATFYFK